MTTEHIQSPGDVFALIPGILGFYPHESVIIITLEPTEKEEGHLIGPILRLDIEHTHHDDIADQLDDILAYVDATHALLLIVSDTLAPSTGNADGEEEESSPLMLGLGRVERRLAAHGITVPGAWITKALATGGRYRRLRSIGDDTATPVQPECWDAGRIASIASAASMRPLLHAGILPALSREESFAAFGVDTSVLGEDTIEKLRARAEQRAEEICADADAALAEKQPAQGLIDFFDEWICALQHINDEDVEVADIMAREDLMELAGCALSSTLLRDIVMGTITADWAPAGSQLLMAAARTFSGLQRANALVMVALFDSTTGCRVRMMPALTLAHKAQPDHRLAGLATDCVRRGLFEELNEACTQASYKVLDFYCPGHQRPSRWSKPQPAK